MTQWAVKAQRRASFVASASLTVKVGIIAGTLSSLGGYTETTLLGGHTSEYESDDGGFSIVVLVFSHENNSERYLCHCTVL